MTDRPAPPRPPSVGEVLAPALASQEALALLALRKSTPVAALGEPGPTPAQLDDLLRIAMRVPDHRKLEPWRFLVAEGEGRHRLGAIFADALRQRDPSAPEAALATARALPMRAPTVVTVISSPVADPKQTPEWEQRLSAGAVCQTLLLAANAMGFAAVWITETPAFDPGVAEALDLKPGEAIAGFIYIGTAREQPIERARPDAAKKVRRL